jgi:hypothetical protein
MDLFDIFSGQESWHTRRLLELAKTLNDEQLDRPLKNQMKVFPWDGPDQSLRQILDRMVQTKEVWSAALTGGSMPLLDNAPPEDRTPSAMLARMDKADAAFHSVLTDVRNRSAWEDTFVDALCEPPETFTFGGMFADVITFNAHRRMLAIDALQRLEAIIEQPDRGFETTGMGVQRLLRSAIRINANQRKDHAQVAEFRFEYGFIDETR